jgi:hypothetical protein
MDEGTQAFYHVTVILDFEYAADSEEHAQILASNHITTSLRLGAPTARRIRLRALGQAAPVPRERE